MVEATPIGYWLGVDIDHTFVELTLLRPAEIYSGARCLLIQPMQQDVSILANLVGRTILWGTANLVLTANLDNSIESPNTPHFIPKAEWVGKIVKRINDNGNLVASGRVNCVRPDEPFENNTLGEGNIGVTVLDVFLGDCNDIMSHRKWPIADCIFDGGHSLNDTINHFNSLLDATDANAHLGGQPKAPYHFICRKTRTEEKLNLFAKKTLPDEIHAVSSQSYCPDKCVKLMRPVDTFFIRQKFWLKGFDECREYARSVDGQFCYSGNNRKRKYVTLLGQDICATAWYKIHGIPKSTFHEYMD